MRAIAWVLASALLLAGCSPAAPRSEVRPSGEEAEAAIRTLVSQEQPGFTAETVEQLELTLDHEGAWHATALLGPPATMSYWPARVSIVKSDGTWEIEHFYPDTKE